MKKIANGVYPTMITPYNNDKTDYGAAKELVDWYIHNGCHGIFAVCQSSEMFYLTLAEKIKLAETVVKQADGKINIVASGHTGNSIDEQAEEANRIYATGADAFVLVSNRLDIHNDGDDTWIENGKRLLDKINPDIPLGIYECPYPYKRLLTPKIIDWCISTGRFSFIKDTCCDVEMLENRLEQMKGSTLKMFNANAQTLLHTLKRGADGYSSIMANFHPDLYVWLYENFEKQPEKAEKVSNILSMLACTEGPAYPCTAKYHLNKIGIKMDTYSTSCDQKRLTTYNKLIIDQMHAVCENLRKGL